jgi:gamma-glutamyltranspeptidase/glutathione hydrolase
MSTGEEAGVVSAASPEAAEAGAEILREGGNAVDAAVAVSLALGVSEPAGSGIGGQSTFIVHRPGAEPFVINGTSFSPAGTPTDAGLADLVGHRATTIPSNLRVLSFAWRQYGSGSLSWQRLVEPAIRCAEEGFIMGSFRRRALLRWVHAIRHNGPATKLLLAPDGSVPQEGSVVRSATLARTLQRVADHGADDFYSGQIAQQIAADMEAHDGWLTLDDLRQVADPPVLQPVKGAYRGWEIYSLPPPASGWVVLMALNLLEEAPEGELATLGGRRLQWLAQALSIAHRHRLIRPVPDLVDYHGSVAKKTAKERARKLFKTLVRAGSGETTHFSVVDREGCVVGVTQSLNAYFGSRTANAELGFLYNDYMREFWANVNSPYALRPGGMPYSSMSATVVARGGAPALVLGSPADERIISAVVQVISHWIDVGQGIEAAVAAPRLHTLKEEVLLETRPEDPAVILGLERLGYPVHQPLSSLFSGELNPYFGGVHAVALEDGQWRGAADPRRDGVTVSSH